jgi:uncharacterized protein YecE (DUF72 family)
MGTGAKFLVGTSGYSFRDWVGTFYPPGTRAKDMFAFYVRHFRTVEINYTFYRMPSAATLEAMARQTPPEFNFWVKAHQQFTHELELGAAKEFLEALEPMQARGQLAGVLLQYPQIFHRTVANRRALQGALEAFASVPAAVEFRHGSWDYPATFEGLRERAVTLVVPDVPDIGSLFRPKATLTSRTGYLRLHSRASAQWYVGAAERYDYSYRDEELQALAADWSHLAEQADRIFVFFNNCRHGQAAKNARRFMEIACGGPANLAPPS